MSRRGSNTILEKMAALEAEKASHREAQLLKHKEFLAVIGAIEKESARAANCVKDTQKVLLEDSQDRTSMKLENLKARRQLTIESLTSSLTVAERLCSTYRTLELNSNASNLDQFCNECGCVHIKDVVTDTPP